MQDQACMYLILLCEAASSFNYQRHCGSFRSMALQVLKGCVPSVRYNTVALFPERMTPPASRDAGDWYEEQTCMLLVCKADAEHLT